MLLLSLVLLADLLQLCLALRVLQSSLHFEHFQLFLAPLLYLITIESSRS